MEISEYGNRNAGIVLLRPADEHDMELIGNEISMIREKTGADFRMTVFKVSDWNRDLSPWKAPAVFGKDDFGGEAEKTLLEILKYCEDRTKTYYIGGYSLAGLFALWAACRTDIFEGVAAASPSVWFPGFTEYVKDNGIKSSHVYLSLGDREERTRNQVMSAVGDRIRETYAILKDRGTDCILEWNAGNHFRDSDIRTAKAFIWLIGRAERQTGKDKGAV